MKSARYGASMALLFVTGCVPDLKTTDPAGPFQEYQYVKIEGIRMTGAMISFNGLPVGEAVSPAGADPMKRRDVVVPDLTATSVSATIEGRDSAGADTLTRVVNNTPVPPPPVFIISGVTGTSALGVDFFINGNGVFPGAGPANVTLLTPFAGPGAIALRQPPDPPASIPASHTTFLWDKNYRIHFDPGVLPAGSYKIQVANAPQYGGQSGQSTNPIAVLP